MLRRLAPILVASLLVLAGCASSGGDPADGSTDPSTDSSATPSAAPDAATAPTLVIGVDGIALTDDEQTEDFAFDAPEPLLALVEELTGEPRTGEDFEDPWGNGEAWGTRYVWDDIAISVLKDGPASVTVFATTIGDTPVQTADGIAVGMTRNAVLAAGGWDEWDEDGDGVADYVGIDEQDVEGTQSLTRPGEIGREYISVALADDIVTELRAPANDFSDL